MRAQAPHERAREAYLCVKFDPVDASRAHEVLTSSLRLRTSRWTRSELTSAGVTPPTREA